MQLISKLENWVPHVREIADRLILGPQKDLLKMVKIFNLSYNSDLNITHTYRWGPGVYDKIRKILFKKYELNKTNRKKIDTIFNAHYRNKWPVEYMLNELKKIDHELRERRKVHAIFQDNTEICEKAITFLLENCCNSFASIQNLLPDTHTNLYLARAGNEDKIVLEVIKEPYILNLFLAKDSLESFDIPMEKTKIYLVLDIALFIMAYSNVRDKFSTEDILQYTANCGNVNILGTYLNDVKVIHPFISLRYDSTITYLDNTTEDLKPTCTGGFDISRYFAKFNWNKCLLAINQWLTTFYNGYTNPMNNIQFSWYGKLPHMTGVFNNIYPIESNECRYINIINTQNELYCDKYECTLRTQCKAYCNVTDTEFDEAQSKEEIEESTLITSNIPRVNETDSTIEQDVLRWVVSMGGQAINLITNERSE